MDEKIIELAEWFYQKREANEEMTEKEITAWEILRDELAEW